MGEKKEIPKSWFGNYKKNNQSLMRMFCFPYAGGSASIFAKWSANLPPAVDIIPVQLPGRANRFNESPYDDLYLLIKDVIDGISPYLDKPFVLFGHSMGALIIFELAYSLLTTKNIKPELLIVSGSRAPSIFNSGKNIHLYDDKQFIAWLQDNGGTPDGIFDSEDSCKVFLPVLRADFKICEIYQWIVKKKVASPILAFGGLQDVLVKREDILEWEKVTESDFKYKMIPGDHFYINNNSHLLLFNIYQALLELISHK